MLDLSNLKEFEDNNNKKKKSSKTKFCIGKGRKHCWKRRNCWLSAFSYFKQCFKKLSMAGLLKVGTVWKLYLMGEKTEWEMDKKCAFSSFLTKFSMVIFLKVLKVGIVWKRVNTYFEDNIFDWSKLKAFLYKKSNCGSVSLTIF